MIEALSMAGVGAALVNDSLVILELNEEACGLLGCEANDARGSTVGELLSAVGQLRAREAGSDIFRLHRTEAGKPVYVRATPVDRGSFRIVRFEDVSRHWRLASRLSSAVEIREELMRQADIGTWKFDPTTGIVELDEVLRARTGVTKGRTTIERALATIHPDDRKKEADAREYVYRTGCPATATLRIRTLDGGWSVMRVHSVPGEKCANGEYVVHSMSEDVTTLVQTQDEAEQNARRLETALLGAKAGVFEWDLKTGQVWGSTYYAELVGEAALERGGTDPFRKYHDDDVEKVREHARRSIEENSEGIGIEARLYRPDGEEFWVYISTRFVRDEHGKPIRVIGILQDINDTKRQERRLEEMRKVSASNERRLELALSGSRAAAFEIDLRTGERWESPYFAQLIGQEAIDRAKDDAIRLWCEEDEPAVRELIAKPDVARPYQSFEGRLYRTDGSEQWVRMTGKYQFNAEGKPVRVTGMFVDINAAKQQELALAQAREQTEAVNARLNIALGAARAGVFEVHLQSREWWASPELQQMVGRAAMAQEEQGIEFGLIHPDDRERVSHALKRQVQGAEMLGIDARLYREDGDDFWVRVFTKVTRDETGQPVRAIGFLQDINDSKQQELALARAREQAEAANKRLSIALKAGRAGVFDVSLTSDESWSSPEFDELVGPEALARVRGGNRLGLYHPDDHAIVLSAWQELERADDLLGVDTRLYREDGEDFWVRVHTMMERDEQGKPVRAVGLLQDINRRKHEEHALIEAKQAAEAAAVAKTNFLASMSHEIRTPLNGVLGMAQVLELGDLQEDQREYVGTIMDCGNSLMALLNDILDISKISAGKLEVNLVEGDLEAAVHRAMQLFQPSAEAKGLDLRVVTKHAPPPLKFDPVRVRQCLSNLLSNAVKFTEVGSVRIELDGDVTSDGAYEARITVRDTGIGIEPASASRLFEPFTQADESTTRKFGGTGLGLSITRDLARLMGGDVSVTSTPGRGSAFELRFRCVPISSESEDAGSHDQPRADLVEGVKGPRVLLVDDNAVNRKVARIFLRAFNAEVVEALDGAEALSRLETEAFDLVLLDVHMPVMDGREVITRIRKSDQPWRDIKVIALTAHAMEGDAQKFIGLGMDDYVAKPIDQGEFNHKIMRALSGERDPEAEQRKIA